MNKIQAAEQFRRALQMFAASLSDEQAMEVATVFDPWKVGKTYAVGDFVTYGKNSVGDPQLYKVVQAHTSQAEWTPNATLYQSLIDGNVYSPDAYAAGWAVYSEE